MDKAPNKFMSLVYQLYTVADGKKTLQEQTSTEHPFEFITGFGIALDAFEQQVMQLEKGSTFDFILEPAQAFGDYDPAGVHKLERDVFAINGRFDHEHVYEGAVITLTDNEDHQFMAKVVKIEDDSVTLDTNHPLAGQTLNFTGTINENRDATEAEISRTIKMLTGDCSCSHCHGGFCGDDQQGGGGCGNGCGGCQ